MHRSSYTQEIGMETDRRKIPAPIAIALLLAAAAGVWWGGREIQGRVDARHAQEQLTAAAEAAAEPSIARK